jgi:outer membrane murein-binding lipoprotein Lpp
MKRSLVAISATLMLAGCFSVARDDTPQSTSPSRELTAQEKAVLGPMIAAKMKDPAAAQIKWMPVIQQERDGVTHYCGLVNGKNSYGGYIGFLRFYAQLRLNAKGQYDLADARAFEEANREPNFIDSRWMNGICEQFGYMDFSVAKT